MIVSAVADPEAFGPSGIHDKLSRREAIGFLNGIVQNGILLDGPTKELLRASIVEADKLPIGHRQPVRIFLEEVSKRHKKLVAKCSQDDFAQIQHLESSAQLTKIAGLLKADVIVTHAGNKSRIQEECAGQIEVVLIEDVSESAFEKTRHHYLQIEKPIDEMSTSELDELIGRSLKYASTIRVFDYLMARSGNRGRKFLSGISFFVTIWVKWCVYQNATTLSVELYATSDRQSAAGFIDAQESVRNMEALRQGLELIPKIRAVVFIKADSNSIFHARGLEACGRAMTLDPGFDSINESGPTRRCLLKLEVAAESHFSDCRKLPDC